MTMRVLLPAVLLIAGSCGSESPATTEGPAPVATVSVTPQTGSLIATAALDLTATVRDAAGNVLSGRLVSWLSGNNAVATVTPYGGVTALAPGSCVITATAEGKSGSATITVTPRVVVKVVLAPVSVALFVGDDEMLKATTLDALGKPLESSVTWSSSNPSVITVDSTGRVLAHALGSARVTATANGVPGTADVSVLNDNVASMQLTPSPVSLPALEQQLFKAVLLDANGNTLNGRTLVWSIGPTSVATIDQRGVVSGVAQGSATLTATLRADPSKLATATVTVTAPLTGEAALIGRYTMSDAYIDGDWHPIPYTWGPVTNERCGGWGGSPGGSQGVATTKQIDLGSLVLRSDHTDTISVFAKWTARTNGTTYDASERDVGTWATADGTSISIALTSTAACGGFAINYPQSNLIAPGDLVVQSPGVLQGVGYRWKKLPRSP